MDNRLIKVMLMDDDGDDYLIIREMLAKSPIRQFNFLTHLRDIA
jgi:hypothetical protein